MRCDSNTRTPKGTDLQSARFNRLHTHPLNGGARFDSNKRTPKRPRAHGAPPLDCFDHLHTRPLIYFYYRESLFAFYNKRPRDELRTRIHRFHRAGLYRLSYSGHKFMSLMTHKFLFIMVLVRLINPQNRP